MVALNIFTKKLSLAKTGVSQILAYQLSLSQPGGRLSPPYYYSPSHSRFSDLPTALDWEMSVPTSQTIPSHWEYKNSSPWWIKFPWSSVNPSQPDIRYHVSDAMTRSGRPPTHGRSPVDTNDKYGKYNPVVDIVSYILIFKRESIICNVKTRILFTWFIWKPIKVVQNNF